MPKHNWWHRVGTFYEFKQRVSDHDWDRRAQCPVLIHGVSFINSMPSQVNIRKIAVLQYSDNDARIDLTVSPLKFDELLKTYQHIFECSYEKELFLCTTIRIKFNSKSMLKLIELFSCLNQQNQVEEFTPLLIDELVQLCISLSLKSDLFYTQKHNINEGTVSTAHVNPNREKSHDLVNLLKYAPINNAQQLEKDLKRLLTKGEDPNQQGGLGETPLSLAVLGRDQLPLMLLLCYGANPWVPADDFSGLAPIELAKQYNDHEKFTFIAEACAQVEKASIVSQSLSTVKTIDTFATTNKITSIFELSDSKTLISNLKEVSQLTVEETEQLLDLYTHTFKTSSGDIKKGFEQAFAPAQGKWIDTIRDKTGHIVAAATFILRKEANDLYIMVDLSFIHPDYQGCGVMPLINYRVAFALQKLNPRLNTYMIFLAASYAAYRRVENVLCTPKYQPDGIKERLKHVLKDLFHYPLTWLDTPDGVYFNVKEDNQLISANKQIKPNAPIMEEFFQKHLRGETNGYVPVLIPIGDDLLGSLQEILTLRQVNFNDQCQILANALEKSVLLEHNFTASERQQSEPRPSGSGAPLSSKYLFWNNQHLESKNSALPAQLAIPLTHKQYNSHY